MNIRSVLAISLSVVPAVSLAQLQMLSVEARLNSSLAVSEACSKYIKSGLRETGHQVDGISVQHIEAATSQVRDQRAVFQLRMRIMPTVCKREIGTERSPKGFVPGYVLNFEGVAPAASDYIMALGSTADRYTQALNFNVNGRSRTNPATSNRTGLEPWPNYSEDELRHGVSLIPDSVVYGYPVKTESGKYITTLEWKVKDLLKTRRDFKKYIAGEEIKLRIPLFYCFKSSESFEHVGARPEIPDSLSIWSIERPRIDHANQQCFPVPNHVWVQLNERTAETPEPKEPIGLSKDFFEIFKKARLPTKDMDGWWSGRCVDSVSKPVQGLNNSLLVAGTAELKYPDGHGQTVTKHEFDMHVRYQTKEDWLGNTVYERPDFFEKLNGKQMMDIMVAMGKRYRDYYGHTVTDYDESLQFSVETQRGKYVHLVRELDGIYYMAQFYKPDSIKVEDPQDFYKKLNLTTMCYYDKKVKDGVR